MKLQIDFDKKIIRIQDTVKLHELIEHLDKLFPENKWKEFSLDTNTTIDWINPISIPIMPYIQPIQYPSPTPSFPGTPWPSTPNTPWWTQPSIICSGERAFNNIQGTYCLSIN